MRGQYLSFPRKRFTIRHPHVGECSHVCLHLPHSLTPSPLLLFYHFFRVAFYSIYLLFTSPIVTPADPKGHSPRAWEYPQLTVRAVQVFWTACVVLLPFLWSEGQA